MKTRLLLAVALASLVSCEKAYDQHAGFNIDFDSASSGTTTIVADARAGEIHFDYELTLSRGAITVWLENPRGETLTTETFGRPGTYKKTLAFPEAEGTWSARYTSADGAGHLDLDLFN